MLAVTMALCSSLLRAGDNSTINRESPTPVYSLFSGIAAISTGVAHTCALNTSGSAFCWGLGTSGQLGNGVSFSSSVPVGVVGLANVVQIAAGGGGTCVLSLSAGVLCWGYGLNGQNGQGFFLSSAVPVSVSGLTAGVAFVSAGGGFSCALLSGGDSVRCWGAAVPSGQLGSGQNTTDSAVPVTTITGAGVTTISTGSQHSCAMNSTGGVLCWGANGAGQCGDGSTVPRFSPTGMLTTGLTVAAVACGIQRTCLLLVDGNVTCTGENARGGLGDGSTSARSTPGSLVRFPWLSPSVSPSVSSSATTTRSVSPTISLSPSPSPTAAWGGGSISVLNITAGASHACGLTSIGAALCWCVLCFLCVVSAVLGVGSHWLRGLSVCRGLNDNGQLGGFCCTPWVVLLIPGPDGAVCSSCGCVQVIRLCSPGTCRSRYWASQPTSFRWMRATFTHVPSSVAQELCTALVRSTSRVSTSFAASTTGQVRMCACVLRAAVRTGSLVTPH